MQNQRTLDILHTSIYGDPNLEAYEEDSLEHHGVLGMSWGRRHGPPYPLDGVDKRVARAEAKRKREKERRLKKLQKAAKKARKLKKREAKEAADIQKKKQKLVKKGDMDAIKKNAKLFTNEELQYIVERDEAKRSILGKKERDEREAFDKFNEKMGQVADVALKLGTVIGTVKQGAEMVSSFKSAKIKDLEIEDKRRASIQKEFEMRFGKDDHSPEAQRFIDRALAGEDYKAPKETKVEKAERKRDEDIRMDRVNEYWDAKNAYEKAVKDEKKQAKADAKAQKKAEKNKGSMPITSYDGYTQTLSDGKSFIIDSNDEWSKKINDAIAKIDKDVVKTKQTGSGFHQSAYAKVTDDSPRRQYAEINDLWKKDSEVKPSYDAGKSWTDSFFTSDWRGQTYEARKGKSVRPEKVEPHASERSEKRTVASFLDSPEVMRYALRNDKDNKIPARIEKRLPELAKRRESENKEGGAFHEQFKKDNPHLFADPIPKRTTFKGQSDTGNWKNTTDNGDWRIGKRAVDDFWDSDLAKSWATGKATTKSTPLSFKAMESMRDYRKSQLDKNRYERYEDPLDMALPTMSRATNSAAYRYGKRLAEAHKKANATGDTQAVQRIWDSAGYKQLSDKEKSYISDYVGMILRGEI